VYGERRRSCAVVAAPMRHFFACRLIAEPPAEGQIK
jgi:hypothetical protein